MPPLGLMSAMPEELAALRAEVRHAELVRAAGREFAHGSLWGREVVAVFSRWGKVAAGSTAAELILRFGVERLVFTGIAGALDPALSPGDIVVARRCVQHDLDASPFFPPGVVPLLGVRELPTDEAMSAGLFHAAQEFLRDEDAWAALRAQPRWEAWTGRVDPAARRAVCGDVATGDRVIASRSEQEAVRARVPSAVCVEMEGAAASQVCFEHGVPFACVRTISDSADHEVETAVRPFFEGLAGAYAVGVVRRWLAGP